MARKHRQFNNSTYTTSIDTKNAIFQEMEKAYTTASMNTTGKSWVTEYTTFTNATHKIHTAASYSNLPVQKRFVVVGHRKIAI